MVKDVFHGDRVNEVVEKTGAIFVDDQAVSISSISLNE